MRENLIYVNMHKAPFDNLSVRQALNYAIDRQEIVDTALEGVGGVAAVGVFSSQNPWSANKELKAYEFDQSKAKALLKDAGNCRHRRRRMAGLCRKALHHHHQDLHIPGGE